MQDLAVNIQMRDKAIRSLKAFIDDGIFQMTDDSDSLPQGLWRQQCLKKVRAINLFSERE